MQKRDHAFFGMYKYPQVGDRIIDLDLKSRPRARIAGIFVDSSGHANAEVTYDNPAIARTSFCFVNHGSTWRLLFPDEMINTAKVDVPE